jgi:hypothetical protein
MRQAQSQKCQKSKFTPGNSTYLKNRQVGHKNIKKCELTLSNLTNPKNETSAKLQKHQKM